jgi:hypothetical protein
MISASRMLEPVFTPLPLSDPRLSDDPEEERFLREAMTQTHRVPYKGWESVGSTQETVVGAVQNVIRDIQ